MCYRPNQYFTLLNFEMVQFARVFLLYLNRIDFLFCELRERKLGRVADIYLDKSTTYNTHKNNFLLYRRYHLSMSAMGTNEYNSR